MMIVTYILSGFIVLFVWATIAKHYVERVPFKEIIKEYAHVVVFVLLWPIDIIWSVYRLLKHPEEFLEQDD